MLLAALPALLLGLGASFYPAAAQTERGVAGGPKPGGGKTAPTAAIAWNDAGHIHYFRYQAYLEGLAKRESAELKFETKDTWPKLKPGDQAKMIKEGEEFLQGRFVTIMNEGFSDAEDKRFVESVWGPEVVAALHNVEVAKKTGDKAVFLAAIEGVSKLQAKLGAANLDWSKIFDNLKEAGKADAVPESPLAVKKSSPFLDAIAGPEVAKILATQRSFDAFVDHLPPSQVSPMAHEPLKKMYAVLSQATPPEKAEIGHIMPTVVQFLRDGKTLVPEANDADSNALAWAVPDDYGRPVKVAIGPALQHADPVIVGNVLAHEFQHIYDFYTGRNYTLDSELRGFKVNVMYTRTLRKAAPDLFNSLKDKGNNGKSTPDDENNRHLINGELATEKAYAAAYEGPADKRQPERFAQEIAFGHAYVRMSQGFVAVARLPLRQAIDPNFGLPRQLASVKALRESLRQEVADLDKKRDKLQKKRAAAPSRALDDEYQRTAKDLERARDRFSGLDRQVGIYEDQLQRMQTEAKWLDKKTKGAPPAYDLELPVDKDYLAP